MKIEETGRGNYLLSSENNETLEDIAISIIRASYELALPFGYGLMRNHKTELTKEMAERMLNGEDISRDYLTNPNTKNEINMDYVFGRCCKTTLYVLENQVKVIISERDREPKKIFKRAKELLKVT